MMLIKQKCLFLWFQKNFFGVKFFKLYNTLIIFLAQY